MIDAEQSALVHVGIDKVWTYVKDIERWASIMPGYQTCEIIDENDSRWTLKVGVGGMIRTVRVQVHVEAWNGPGEVLFRYKLQGDPVEGGGAYRARAVGAGQTEIALKVRVEGGGPMAPMWEAMGKPLLPQFAAGFANELKTKIEAHFSAEPQAEPPRRSWFTMIANMFQEMWAALFGKKA
jgi:carbon monoxide dehydrogenase subunit G